VSWERVVSGLGLGALESSSTRNAAPWADWKRHLEEAGEEVRRRRDPARHGTILPAARPALRLFVGAYGAESGNMALRAVARSGIYLGGGIAPRILPALRWPEFLEAFRDKENLRPLLESIPVWVIKNELTGSWERLATPPCTCDHVPVSLCPALPRFPA